MTVQPENEGITFPIKQGSSIIAGFGRGSSELGIPTANVPINESLNKLSTGIYYGWCRLIPVTTQCDEIRKRVDGKEVLFNHGNNLTTDEVRVLPMVMSIGWNPYYHNKDKTAEVHIIHKFNKNFYGSKIEYVVLGYIRPELNFNSVDELIETINGDIKYAKEKLESDEKQGSEYF
ncbi:Riboflavin kinase [Candida viswanathii]|uniref:Riboflavin kinase n=1 Tax=Candida viswanathii TaxID=5486 RepID=A0A367XZA2_9ASCO|nr:Riboflavin kinase [Candida viswanathii]